MADPLTGRGRPGTIAPVNGRDSRRVTVDVLDLGSVVLPDWHPRSSDLTSVTRGFAIGHPDGLFVFDTGVASDSERLNELYEVEVVPIVEALNRVGIDERDVDGIVNSHLHFDHCGQNRFLPGVPIYSRQAELDAVELPHFTIPEWARVDHDRLRLVDGDEEIAPGLHILSTPGHTPGHQSMLIDEGDAGRTVVVGQCCYTCAEFAAGEVALEDAHDESMHATAVESLGRLRALRPNTAHIGHDRTVFRARQT